MVCQACGNPVTAEVRFCPRCGAEVVAAAPAPPPPAAPQIYPPVQRPLYAMAPPRVQRNLQVLGVLWCIFGAFRIVGVLIGIFAMRLMSSRHFDGGHWSRGYHVYGPFGGPWMAALVPLIAIISVVTAFLAFLVGFSLLTRQSWGRVLGIVVAILTLLKFPFGTALGIYTLWVLVPSQSAMEYDAIADHS